MSKIVMDIDGILTDIWSGVEDSLRQRAKTANYADRDNIPELSDLAAYLAFKALHGYSQNGYTEQAFLRNFRFTSGYVSDYYFSAMPEVERNLIFLELANPKIFENPPPMYYQVNKAKYHWVWADVELFPVHEGTLLQYKRIPFDYMIPWLANFCIEHGHTLEMHSMVYTPECEKARRSWFEREIQPYTQGVITLKLDCGEKSQLVGDLVIEDCLENLFKADTPNRVLFNTFHNSYSSSTNQMLAAKYSGINPDTQKLVCVSNFDDIVEVLIDFNNLVVKSQNGDNTGTVPCVFDLYTAMRNKRGA